MTIALQNTTRGALFGLLAAALLAGCNQAPPAPAPAAKGVAVIDLDRVAESLGSDQQIAQAMKQRQAALNEKLVELAGGYVEQLESHREKIGGEQNAGVQLAQYQEQANESLGVAKRQAQQDLTQHRARLVKQFRDAVRPAAREVAAERGLSLIVTKQDSLLFDYAAEADITQAVIERLKAGAASQPQPAPPAATAAGGN